MTTESTAGELRKTGIGVIGDVRRGIHYFYETNQDLLDTLVQYFKAGLDLGWIQNDNGMVFRECEKHVDALIRHDHADHERFNACAKL